MKTNLGIELTDDERDALANLIDGKDTTRLATRKEISAIAQNHIGGLARRAEAETYEDVHSEDHDARPLAADNPIYVIDESDPLTRAMADPDNPSYVRGWNTVKARYAS